MKRSKAAAILKREGRYLPSLPSVMVFYFHNQVGTKNGFSERRGI